MLKYILLIIIALTLTGCPAVEKYRAEQEAAQAAQQAAIADQMAQQARMVESDNQAAMMGTLAQAAKPVYWPIVLIVTLFAGVIVLFMRWHMVTVAHVATGQRLLPQQMSFAQLRMQARREGYELEVAGASYFLVDNDGNRQKIRGLIGVDYERHHE